MSKAEQKFQPTEWAKIAEFGGEQKRDFAINAMPQIKMGTAPEDMPLPPPEVRLYGEDDEGHVEGGRHSFGNLVEALSLVNKTVGDFSSILEFGCSNGRVLRWLLPQAYEGAEVWGVDLDARRALWSQQVFGPWARIAVTTNVPHLPFEDEKFELLFAYSILTHIDPTWLSWFLELGRILRKGGLAFITVLDEEAIERMIPLAEQGDYFLNKIRNESRFDEFREEDFLWFGTGEGVFRNVFFKREWLLNQLSPVFKHVGTVPATMGGFQTGLLLERQ